MMDRVIFDHMEDRKISINEKKERLMAVPADD